MTVSPTSYRRPLLICAALLVAVALAIALGVIPPVKADTFPAAAPESAALGLWANVVIDLVVAAVLLFIATRASGPNRVPATTVGFAGFLALLLAVALVDAAFAFRSHGPPLRTATILLVMCSAAGLVAAALLIRTAFLLRKRT